jgi:hypothetical protein
MKTSDQKFCQHRVGIGAIEEWQQILSDGRPPFPPVLTSEEVVEVLPDTHTMVIYGGKL